MQSFTSYSSGEQNINTLFPGEKEFVKMDFSNKNNILYVMYIDINDREEPNKAGKDVFQFAFNKDGIIYD